MKIVRLAALGLAALAALSLGAAVQGQARLTPVRAASVSPHWSVTLGPVVASRKGYWRAEGLDVRFSVVGPAATHVAALAGGSFDFSVNLTTDTLARAAGQGAKLYAIMGSTNQNQYVLFARPGIRSVQELRGKRIVIDTVGGPIDLFAREILEQAGLGPRDVVLVPVAGTIEARVATLVAGASDAAIGTFSQWPPLRAQGISLLFKMSDIHPDWQTAVMAVSGVFLERNPAAVKGFIKGFIRAFQFMRDPRNEAELLALAREAKLVTDAPYWGEELALQRTFWPQDGGLNLKGAGIVLLRERDDGRIPRDFTLDKLLRIAPLLEAQRELGLRR